MGKLSLAKRTCIVLALCGAAVVAPAQLLTSLKTPGTVSSNATLRQDSDRQDSAARLSTFQAKVQGPISALEFPDKRLPVRLDDRGARYRVVVDPWVQQAELTASSTGLISGTPTTAGTSTGTLSANNADGKENATPTPTNNQDTDCASPTAVGAYTFCSQAYNDVGFTTSTSVSLSPSPGNGVEVFASFCATSCSSAPTQTATIGDNINSTESCFASAPHSPYSVANTYVPDYETIYAWYCPSIPSGVTTITVTTSATSGVLAVAAIEWKAGSIATSNYFESVDNVVNSGDTANEEASIPTSASTVNADDLITAVVANCGASIPAIVGSGYTGIIVNPSGTAGYVMEAEAVTSTGVQTATTTWSSGDAASYNCNLGTGGSNDTWFGVIVPLVGSKPPVALFPTSLGFGSEAVNNTSPAKAVILKNTGNRTLDISQIAASENFTVASTTCGATLAEGKTCKVYITFTPTELGAVTGTLTFTDDAQNSPQTVPLSGKGIVDAALNPANATYAKQAVGTTSAAKTFTLTNNQTADLTSILISTTGDFAVSATTCGTSLAAKSKCTISVTFMPTDTGMRTGQLIVKDSASDSPQTSNLRGTGD